MSDDRVAFIFDRISAMHITLDDDPLARGPKFLNGLVALSRNYMSEVQSYLREIQMDMRLVDRDLRYAKADFELQWNQLMATDPEIRALRAHSKADREAVAMVRLSVEARSIKEFEMRLVDLQHVMTVVTSKFNELREVSKDIRLQRQLIQAEIDIGSAWGNDHGDYVAPSVNSLLSTGQEYEFEEPPVATQPQGDVYEGATEFDFESVLRDFT